MQTTLFSALRRPLLLLATALPLLFASACKKDDPITPPPAAAPGTIVAIAQANPDFSILVEAVVKADLATTLSGPGPFTVFAPINAAFASLPAPFNTAANIKAITSAADIAMLKEIILYHAVAGTKKAADLATGPLTSLKAAGATTNVLNLVKTGNNIVINGNTNVVTADIVASNGVIHVIDKVLMPASTGPGTIAAIAVGNPDFSTLVAAATKAGLVGALSGPGPLTVFAPTNAAFAALGAPFNTAANIAAITDAAQIATLTGILQYHVLGSRKAAADFATGASSQVTIRPASAAGVFDNLVYISKGAAGVFLNGSTKVTTADVPASNGIIHIIDKVLLPPSRTVAAIAVAASTAATNPEFTLLVQALTQPVAAPLLAAASNPASNLTVFAPTDAAFRALLTALNLPNVAAIPPATLLAVLQTHIITSGRNFSSDLINGPVTTANPTGPVTIGVSAAGVTVRAAGNGTNVANVTSANILANNGVVHVIDRVLLP